MVRDDIGKVIMSFGSPTYLIINPVHVEALASRRAMFICNDSGLNQIEFEGDFQYLVRLVKSREEGPSKLRPIMFDIQELLKQHTRWRIQFVYRDANKSAHNLAKLTCTLVSKIIWMEECLNHVMPFV